MVSMAKDVHKVYLSHAPFMTWIAKEDLLQGATYLCKSQYFHVGTWDGSKFTYCLYKEHEKIYGTDLYYGENGIGTVKPLEIFD
mgnify:CR=1 FL=1